MKESSFFKKGAMKGCAGDSVEQMAILEEIMGNPELAYKIRQYSSVDSARAFRDEWLSKVFGSKPPESSPIVGEELCSHIEI